MYLKQKKKKKIYILFSRTSLFLFFIHFIKSGHSFTLILTLSRSSLIPLKLHSLNVATIVKRTPVQYNLLLLLLFFFFFFSFYQIRSHSLSLVHRHLSSQASQAHSLNTHFSSADPLQVSCLCLLHVMLWVFDLDITSSFADPPIHFGFLIWIHFMWMSLFFIFDCCSGLLAW